MNDLAASLSNGSGAKEHKAHLAKLAFGDDEVALAYAMDSIMNSGKGR